MPLSACSKSHTKLVTHKIAVVKHHHQHFTRPKDPLINSKSRVIKAELYSKSLHQNWPYAIYLPAGYSRKLQQNLPTLIMLHGVYGKYDNLLEYGNSKRILDQIENSTKKPMAVVFPDGFNSFYVNQEHGMQMEDAMMHDLLPLLKLKYHLAQSADKTAIGGISMGGYGASRFSLKYPDKFKVATLISPAVWPSLPVSNPIRQNVSAFRDGVNNWSDRRYRQLFPANYLSSKSQKIKFFIETTRSDTTVPVRDVNSFVQKLKQHQVKVSYIKDNGDNHGWHYWKKALPNAYKWTLEELNK